VSGRYLLDTHVFLWAALTPKKLSRGAQRIFSNQDAVIYLSIASIWEMAIKKGLGKLKLPMSLREFVDRSASEMKVFVLPASASHVLEVEFLPMHHSDPFDRLLISQSKLENLSIITSDDGFEAYGIKRCW
jgi:PIN domain nuclease of toxin-antitoxin system